MKYFKILIGSILGLIISHVFFSFVFWTFTFESLNIVDRGWIACITFCVSLAGGFVGSNS